jgi:hypothetical protein
VKRYQLEAICYQRRREYDGEQPFSTSGQNFSCHLKVDVLVRLIDAAGF